MKYFNMASQSLKMTFDLEGLVTQPTWREVLLELVRTEQLDPWDIDIAVVSEGFLKKLKEMELRDLHVPANLILAASILLRFKSDSLKFGEEVQEASAEVFLEENRPPVEIPILHLRMRIPPKRKVTLPELVVALEDAMKRVKQREEAPIITPEIVDLELPKYNIEEKMDEIVKKIRASADKEGMVTFSSLLVERTSLEMIHTLLPLLHLAQERKINLFQEEIFGEIFIVLISEGEEVAG